jgi:hypothetical protein
MRKQLLQLIDFQFFTKKKIITDLKTSSFFDKKNLAPESPKLLPTTAATKNEVSPCGATPRS